MSLKTVTRYIVTHWRGEQGLVWSLAVNLVALRAAIFLLQDLARPAKYHDYHDWAPAVLVAAILLHGVVFVWQAVGVFRAGENHIRHHGAIALHWGAQLGVLLAFWLTASSALQAWQMTLDVPDYENYAEKMDAERAGKYRIFRDSDSALLIDGTLELGVTRRLAALLAEDPGIGEIVLSSAGGNIYEARGLARLFRDRGLATLVADECSSACTTAFIGGKTRRLKPGGRLGFHQYRIEADYDVLGARPKDEEGKDKALYLAAGVKQDFVARMHSAAPGSMWYPEAEELLDAGVVTAISE
ncbi:hypothetical protein SAMN05877838_0369 [Hoeflea halophila]|uniref:Uncharacterized protein n=1 Tax=Hoeflea halophila TaxID=714899 RepID=A0A286HLK7_9HYPH|nr:hypothetical protein [Hoeflea halophila]SOE08642.1 hypothetical protein SAMN05877838_0369 [Hoeflea halophila]